jgi:hypothetical protein
MSITSPAQRVRHASICIGVAVALFIFAPLAGCDLLDQWIGGYASATFMLGTALIYTGTCLAAFGCISGMGYAVSIILRDDVPYDSLSEAEISGLQANARMPL